MKGITVNHTEPRFKILSLRTGLLVMLRALRESGGSSVHIVDRGSLLIALVSSAFSLLLYAPLPAFAGKPPQVDYATTTCFSTGHTSMELKTLILPGGEPAQWTFEYSSSEAGPWSPVPGAQGTVTQAEFEVSTGKDFDVTSAFTGLTPEVPYYIRVTASNSSGSMVGDLATSEESHSEHIDYKCEALPFHPTNVVVTEFAPGTGPGSSHVKRTTAEFYGLFKPHGEEVHWHYEYSTSENGGFHEAPGASGTVLAGTENEAGYSEVSGDLGGLDFSTTYYVRLFAETEPEPGVHKSVTSRVVGFTTGGPPAATAYAVHTVSGEELVALGAVSPNGFDTHYHFEYVSQQHFEEHGFAGAASTPEVDAGSESVYVGASADLPGLQPGVTYHYRLVASSEAASQGVDSGEQTLTMPVLAAVGASGACPNESLRIGPSAALPDCRAYEQVTPAEKHGAQDTDTGVGITDEFRVGEDGEHFMLHAPGTQWGSSPDASKSNYFFSRTPGGWQMASASPQPQSGIDSHVPVVFNPDLTETGVEVGWADSDVSSSQTVELQVGPSGGPYTTIASIARKYISGPLLVAASPDLGKLIIGTEDRALAPGHTSATKSGSDLYEYTEGQVRQVNVLSGTPGAPIGMCGAAMADGNGSEGLAIPPRGGGPPTSSAHSVSADGGRVFFYAVSGSQCPTYEQLQAELANGGPLTHLYERVNGVETVDIGEYKFLAANPQGSLLLLEHFNGGAGEAFLYDTETHTAEHLFTVPGGFTAEISADFSTIYLSAGDVLTPEAQAHTGSMTYRYDVSSKTLHYIPLGFGGVANVSANGRYLVSEGGSPSQIYRYDSSENVVECVSCASPFDPQPKFASTVLYGIYGHDGTPNQWFASEDGDFVFFETPDALVPQDTDGEIEPSASVGAEPQEFFRSRSSDVYEWRREGVDGCAAVAGCLALISGGRGGGYLTELVGASPSGRDVFFATHESLVPQDKDSSGDVYDARIDGGFPPPPPGPVECEGDACAAPFAPPIDATPASAVFQGAGEVVPGGEPVRTVKKTGRKAKKKKKQHSPVRKRRGKRAGAKRSVRRRGGAK